ncbi:MAG: Wzz/FepE/Etk N-terminal domain-containing protein [Lachnospiraceae bacterium]|nr:Wzz/FepE/Etk N-terminal domain-containing protein [Lachnospiraceae bacterium]
MQEEMRLQDYIRISFSKIWKNKFLIAAVTLLFFLIGILYASWQTVTNTYYAKTTVYTIYGATTQETAAASDALSGYSDVIKSKKVCERAESIIGEADITANYIRNSITTSYNKSSTVMTIAAYSDNPVIALKIANAVAEAFVTEIQSITGNDRIQILDKADDVRLSSNGLTGVIKTVIMFGMAGFAISVVIAVAGVIFSNKIKSVEQCLDEDEEEILGIIPFIE